MDAAGLTSFLNNGDEVLSALFGAAVEYNGKTLEGAVVSRISDTSQMLWEGNVIKRGIRVRVPKDQFQSSPAIGGTVKHRNQTWRIVSVTDQQWETSYHITCGQW